jgi:DNA replication and repair protein RecF
VHFQSLTLANFRNYDSGRVALHPRVNVFCGLNGAGKTNMLDAVYYLCLGKSYFAQTDKLVIRQGADFFRIEGILTEANDTDKVSVKMKAGGRKEIDISGKRAERLADYIGRFLCVIITPDDIHLMLEGSEQRRTFLNNTLVQTDPAYLHNLMTYSALLKRRNSLLKTFAENRTFDALLLESVTAGMFGPAAQIHEVRQAGVAKLVPLFEAAYADISGKRESCGIAYESQLAGNSLEGLMQLHLEKDRVLARTTQGIHKDDLVFTMNGEPLKHFASQGQLKSFVLALKMAQYKLLEQESGRKPVFLLDDIFDKLDQQRVTQLMHMLTNQQFGQIFITDTSAERMQQVLGQLETGYALFQVERGAVVNEITT